MTATAAEQVDDLGKEHIDLPAQVLRRSRTWWGADNYAPESRSLDVKWSASARQAEMLCRNDIA